MAMLKRDEYPNPNPTNGPTVPSDLLLGRGARFEGKLTFEGTVRIDATLIGSITTNDVLVVGEAARIDANIVCGTIIVHGEVNGNISAKTAVEVRQGAKLRGDIETGALVIEKGAIFQGACKMDSRGKAPAPAPAPKGTAVS